MQQSSNDKPIEMIDGNGKNVLNFAGGLVLLAALVSGGMMGCQTCNADQQEKQETEAKQQANREAAPLITEEQIAERKKRNAYIKEQQKAGGEAINKKEWSQAKTAAENMLKIAPDNVSAQELKRVAFWGPLPEKTSGNFKYKVHPTRPVCEISGLHKDEVVTLVLPESIEGKKVIRLGRRAFYHCSSLTTVTIPSSVTSIGERAFSDCRSLTTVTIPSSVTSIEEGAFAFCRLTSVTIPSSVTSIGRGAFCGNMKLTEISAGEGNPVYLSIDGVLFTKDRKTLVQYPGGKLGPRYVIPSSVTSIGDLAFSCCIGLTSVTIPSSVTSIGNGAFSYCSSLTSVTIPSSVTSIGGSAFSNCRGLKSVTIPKGVKIGKNVFYGCPWQPSE